MGGGTHGWGTSALDRSRIVWFDSSTGRPLRSASHSPMDLPSFIPIFPLPNVVLFPEVPLPLHIFEPRYRQMVRDALAGSGIIGMTLLRGDWEDEYHAAPEVYRVG